MTSWLMTSSLTPSFAALGRALSRGPRTWCDLLIAVLELARARRRLGRHSARALIELARRQCRPDRPAPSRAATLPDRVAYAIPGVAAHVPWRADCFIQALAAQSWLARSGVPSEISIGVRQDRAPGFEAHAWLVHDGRNITGGDVTGFTPIVEAATQL